MIFRNKTLLIGFITLLFSTASFAQNFQGKAYYFSKTTADMDGWGGRKMSEDQKKQIAERMRGMLEKIYILKDFLIFKVFIPIFILIFEAFFKFI